MSKWLVIIMQIKAQEMKSLTAKARGWNVVGDEQSASSCKKTREARVVAADMNRMPRGAASKQALMVNHDARTEREHLDCLSGIERRR